MLFLLRCDKYNVQHEKLKKCVKCKCGKGSLYKNNRGQTSSINLRFAEAKMGQDVTLSYDGKVLGGVQKIKRLINSSSIVSRENPKTLRNKKEAGNHKKKKHRMVA